MRSSQGRFHHDFGSQGFAQRKNAAKMATASIKGCGASPEGGKGSMRRRRGKPRGEGCGASPEEKERVATPRRRRRGKPRGKGAEGRGAPRGGGGGASPEEKEQKDGARPEEEEEAGQAPRRKRPMRSRRWRRKMIIMQGRCFFPLYAVIWQLLAVASFTSRFDILDIAEFSPSLCSETPSHV